jgi:transcriptional regulator with XRE-family HTH domain
MSQTGMTLGDKLKHLRQFEGELRGLGRPMTKAEVLRAMRTELGESVSHAYLCQLESGARTHMSPMTRALLARFFKVLPGYLVSDPEGYQAALVSDVASEPDALRAWLAARAEDVRDDLALYHVLLKMSRHPNPRRLFENLDELMDAESSSSRRSA